MQTFYISQQKSFNFIQIQNVILRAWLQPLAEIIESVHLQDVHHLLKFSRKWVNNRYDAKNIFLIENLLNGFHNFYLDIFFCMALKNDTINSNHLM